MKEFVDIYSRLIIATITFVGPIIIVLLSTFGAGEKRRKELAKETENELNKQAAEMVNSNPEQIKEVVGKINKEYVKIDKKTKSQLALLNPIIQFWCIYGSLAFSLSCLMFFYLTKDTSGSFYNKGLSIVLFIVSLTSYFLSLFFIIRVFYTIIGTKKLIES